MVINSGEKSPFEIRDSTGKEFKEIYDNRGRLFFKNWNEIRGSSPITFRGYGKNLTECRIYGNTVQNGTPTPENPVEVRGCGERTENFFEEITSLVSTKIHRQIYVGDGYFTLSTNAPLVNDTSALFFLVSGYTDSANIGIPNRAYNNRPHTVESVDGYVTVVYRSVSVQQPRDYQTMLTSGTISPDHYIPYGYKIPVTVSDGSNAVTTPIYIGNEPLHKIGNYVDYVDFNRGVVVRRIKKLVLTGEENWVLYNGNYYSSVTDRYSLQNMPCRCTHTAGGIIIDNGNLRLKVFASRFTTVASNLEEWKSYLAAQYAAGTPVTIWYILAEPEEEPLEQLITVRTLSGTNILTADTIVQPSEIYIKGKIKSIT